MNMMENFEKIDTEMTESFVDVSAEKALENCAAAQGTGAGTVATSEDDTKPSGLPKKPDAPRLSGAQRRKLKKEQKMAEGTWVPSKFLKPNMQKSIGGFKRSIAPDYPHSLRTTRGGAIGRHVSSRGSRGRGGAVRGDSSRGGRTLQIINYQYPRPSAGTSSSRPEVSYRKVDVGIRMAVIHKLHPDIMLSRGQGDLIESKLEQLIDGLPIGGPSPQFNSTRFEGGAFWLTCANEATKDWLVETVAGLESMWEGGVLMAVLEKDMPRRQNVLVWIPGSSAEEDAVRARLVVQNPTLNTDDWHPLSRKVVEKGQTIAFSVGEGSIEALEKLDFRPYWGLGRVVFKIPNS